MCHSPIRGQRSMWPIPVSVSPLFSLSFTLFDRKNRRRNRYEVGRLTSIARASNVYAGGSVNRPYLMKMLLMEKTAREVAERLRTRGHVAYFAGGCVRDMVRGLAAKDFDVATDATPDIVQKIFSRTYAVGAQFGVVVVVENGFNVEVATFRSDGAYLDHRHPVDVRFSSPEEDAKRRDFTINGMFFDPEKNEVIDFVGGRADLKAKMICAIGEPGERIREDLVRIFLSANRVRGWDLLDESGLLRTILPELEAMKGCLQPEQFHPEGDVFQHTRLMLELLPEKVSLPLVASVLFHDVAKPPTASVDETGRIRFNEHDRIGAEMTESIMERLRFSRAEIDAAVEMVRQHMVFKDVPRMRVAKLKRFMARPTFEEELELHRVDCASSHQMMDNYEFLLRKREEFANEPIIPPPLLRGDDLIALGFKPG